MRTANLVEAHPTYFNLNGKPLVGRIAIFERDTQQFSEVWLNPEGTTRASNPMKTNGAGKTEQQVFVEMPDSGQKAYTIYVQEFLGDDASSMDEYWTDGTMWKTLYDYLLVVDAGSGVKSVTVDSVSEIAGADPSNGIVVAKGFYSAGDCPARTFVYTSRKVFPEDGCTSIKSKDGGYWTWFPDPVIDSGCFGIIPSASKENIASSLLSLQTHLASAKVIKKVCFRNGNYPLDTDIELDCEIEMKPGASIYPSSDGLHRLSCRAFSGQSSCLGSYLKRTKLLVSEGEYRLSWHGDSYNQILDIGTPETVVVDKSMSGQNLQFSKARFVGTNGDCQITASGTLLSINECSLEKGPIFDIQSGVKPAISDCGTVSCSDFSRTFYSSYINDSTDTSFVIDGTVWLDEYLDATTGCMITSASYFYSEGTFDRNAETKLKINATWMRNNIASCIAEVVGTRTLHRDWFTSGSYLFESAIRSSCKMDLDGGTVPLLSKYSDNLSADISIENGTLNTGDFKTTGSFSARNVSIAAGRFQCGTLGLESSIMNASSVFVAVLAASHSQLKTDSGTVAQTTSLQGSTVSGLTMTQSVTLNNSTATSDCSIDATSLSLYGSVVFCPAKSESASVNGGHVYSLNAENRTVLSESMNGEDTIHDNGSFSQKRLTKEYADDKFRTYSEAVYDTNGNVRINGGMFQVVPELPTTIDMFGKIPSIPVFCPGTEDGSYIDLAAPVGKGTSYTYKRQGESTSEYMTKTFYGMIGASRPKPGQIIVLVPSAITDTRVYAYFCQYAYSRTPVGGPEAYNDYGGAKSAMIADNGSILFFQESGGLMRAVIQFSKPVFLLTMGYGADDSGNVMPVFWPMNDVTWYTEFG